MVYSYIMMFVTEFSRNSHISDFQSFPYSSFTPLTMSPHFSSDLRESQDQVQGQLRQQPLSAHPHAMHGDANGYNY